MCMYLVTWAQNIESRNCQNQKEKQANLQSVGMTSASFLSVTDQTNKYSKYGEDWNIALSKTDLMVIYRTPYPTTMRYTTSHVRSGIFTKLFTERKQIAKIFKWQKSFRIGLLISQKSKLSFTKETSPYIFGNNPW